MYSFLGHKHLLMKNSSVITPWDVSTLTDRRTGSIGSDLELFISSDGLNVYAYNDSTLLITQYILSTPLDNASIGGVYATFDASGQLGRPNDIFLSYSGDIMFLLHTEQYTGTVFSYSLSTPFNISTAVYQTSWTIDYMQYFRQIRFVGNGYIMYACGWEIHRYDLTVPYDITTAVKSSQFNLNAPAYELSFRNDGRYVIGINGSYADSYEMTTPYDITTLTEFASLFVVTTVEKYTNGFFVDREGKYLFNTGSNYGAFSRRSLAVEANPPQIGPWVENTDIISGLGDIGGYSRPAAVTIEGELYLFSTEDSLTLNTWKWNGSAWVVDAAIQNGITILGTREMIEPVYIGSDIFLIFAYGNDFRGYLWNGSSWDANTTIIDGLSTGSNASLGIFYVGATLYCIGATYSNDWSGFVWNGSGWTADLSILTGIIQIQYDCMVEPFYFEDELYLLVLNHYTFAAFKWNGSSWNEFSTMKGGLEGDSSGEIYGADTPTVLYIDKKLHLILGSSYGAFDGFKY